MYDLLLTGDRPVTTMKTLIDVCIEVGIPFIVSENVNSIASMSVSSAVLILTTLFLPGNSG